MPMPRLDGLRALIVDDEPDARALIRSVLEKQGASVREASAAREAIEQLRADPPDVLVSDIGMPDLDGYQFIRQYRAMEPKGSRLPALALTAFART
jgi:CheY-like chemotaxis protein